MTEAITTFSRYFSGEGDNYSTLIPCLKKKSKNKHTKTVVHVGKFNETGKPICLCSQQEKDNKRPSASREYAPSDDADWMDAGIDEYPSVTCKSCMRSGAFSDDGESLAIYYLADKLDTKVEAMRIYEKPEPCESSEYTGTCTPEPEPFPRVLSGPNRIVLDAIIERRCDEFIEPTPLIHSAIFDEGTPGGIPLCMKNTTEFGPSHALYYTANYAAHPSITCPACAELQRRRRVEEEPKRDKSLSLRKQMIALVEPGLRRDRKKLDKARNGLYSLIEAGHGMITELHAVNNKLLTDERSLIQLESNLVLMKQCIIAVN